MRILAQKPKSNQQSTSKTLTRAVDEQSRERNFVFNTQPAASHQATRPLPETQDEAPEINTAATHSAHDFSRIPLHSGERRPIQTKLKVGTPGDAYEQEADRVANHLPSMPEPQPACACGGGCSNCLSEKTAGRNALLQTKGENNSSQQALAPPIVNEALNSSGQPLDASAKAFFEPRFGHDFSQVRIHTDSKAVESTREVNALAYTVGRDIVFAPGQYEPQTVSGKALLAHELTHVLQQANQSTASATAGVLQRADPPEGAQQNAENKEDDTAAQAQALIDSLSSLYQQVTEFPQNVVNQIMETARAQMRKIIFSKDTSISFTDEFIFRQLLRFLPVKNIKTIEKDLVLWPKIVDAVKMRKLIAIVTSFTRQDNKEESERGKFSEDEGSEARKALMQSAEEYKKKGVDQCLNFLMDAGMSKLYTDKDEQEGVETAKEEYYEGVREREEENKKLEKKRNTKKDQLLHIKTLSRLASELRLQGLVGPVNILPWKNDKHVPPPSTLFDNLSSAGEGWYFFLVSLISEHTFVLVVHVLPGGTKRQYFKIQDRATTPLPDSDALNNVFNRRFNPDRVSSRAWQIYLVPKD